MKKLISMLLVVCMLATLTTTFSVFAETTSAETVLVSNGFDGETLGSGTWLYKNTGSSLIDAEAGTGKMLSLARVSTDTNVKTPMVWHNLSTVVNSGKLLLSFEVKSPAAPTGTRTDTNDMYLWLNLGSSNYASTDSSLGTGSSDSFAYRTFRMDWSTDGKLYAKAENGRNTGTIANIPSDTELTANQWYAVDVLIDLEGKTISQYVDGKLINSQELASVFPTTIGSVAFCGRFGNGLVGSYLIDNVEVRSNASVMDVASVDVNETDKYIDVNFNHTFDDNQSFSVSGTSVAKCGSNETLTVTSVTKTGRRAVRVAYDGTIDAGREYMINFAGGVADFAGSRLSEPVTFNMALGTSASAHITESEDFEGMTAAQKAAVSTSFEFANGFINPNATTLQRCAPAIVTETDSATSATNDVLNIAAKDNALNVNAIFTLNPSNVSAINTSAMKKINYQFDLKVNATTASNGGDFILRDGSELQLFRFSPRSGKMYNELENTTTKTTLATIEGNKWYTIKVTIDYENAQILYYIDGENTETLAFSEFTKKNNKTIDQFDVLNAWFLMYITAADQGYYVDNIDIWSDEPTPTVSGVRFVDSTGKEHIDTNLGADIKTIKIGFSRPIKESSLTGAVTLQKNGVAAEGVTGAFDADSNIYTLTKNEGYFDVSDNYTLTVAGTVASGYITIGEDVVYNFRTDKGEQKVNSVALTDTEGAALDISALPDNVKVTVTGINTLKDDNICIIVAGYSGDKLKYARVANTCAWNIGQTSVEKTFDITGEETVETIRAFVWDGISTMTPLYNSIGVPSN